MLLTIAMLHIGIYLILHKSLQELSGASAAIIVVITAVAGIVLFITYFLMLTKKFITYIKEMIDGINQISRGNFNNRIEINNEDEFALQ
jgi:methyl-accepting chemotaxis protein